MFPLIRPTLTPLSMKRLILPLIALTVLVGACSSPTKPTAQKPGGPAKSTGTRPTAWGELPTYDQAGHSFDLSPKKLRVPVADHTQWVTLDVMVNTDGSVEDATIRQSSGNPVVDRTVLAAYIGTHYSLKLGPTDPAPYVVQQAIVFQQGEGLDPELATTISPYRMQHDSMPPPGAPYYQAWSGAGGGWSGGGSYSSSSSSGTSSSSSSSGK